MAQNLGTFDTWVLMLLKGDSTVPGPTTQQRYDIYNDIVANYHAAIGVRQEQLASGASIDATRWEFSGAASTLDPIAVDAVEVNTGSGANKPLRLVDEDEVRYLQQTEGRVVTAAADVTMSSAKITHDNAGNFYLTGYFYPMRAATTVRVMGRSSLAVLSAAGDLLVVSPQAWYMLGRVSAVVLGAIMRRPPWLLQRIAEPIRGQLRLAFDTNRLLFHTRDTVSRELLMGVIPPRDELPVPELSRVADE